MVHCLKFVEIHWINSRSVQQTIYIVKSSSVIRAQSCHSWGANQVPFHLEKICVLYSLGIIGSYIFKTEHVVKVVTLENARGKCLATF